MQLLPVADPRRKRSGRCIRSFENFEGISHQPSVLATKVSTRRPIMLRGCDSFEDSIEVRLWSSRLKNASTTYTNLNVSMNFSNEEQVDDLEEFLAAAAPAEHEDLDELADAYYRGISVTLGDHPPRASQKN